MTGRLAIGRCVVLHVRERRELAGWVGDDREEPPIPSPRPSLDRDVRPHHVLLLVKAPWIEMVAMMMCIEHLSNDAAPVPYLGQQYDPSRLWNSPESLLPLPFPSLSSSHRRHLRRRRKVHSTSNSSRLQFPFPSSHPTELDSAETRRQVHVLCPTCPCTYRVVVGADR